MKKTELGQVLIKAAKEALDVERGKKKVKQTKIIVKDPPAWTKARIIRLRKEKYAVSQAIFALLLNVNKKTVESWEQGINSPGGSSSRLLQIFNDIPQKMVEEVVIAKNSKKNSQNSYRKTGRLKP